MDEVDWRLKVTATVSKDTVLPWNGHRVQKGDRLKVVSVVDLPKKRTLTIPVPNMTALYISNSQKAWGQYWELRKENKIDSPLKKSVVFKDDVIAFDALELIATSVISAYTAIEVFCNDSIPEPHEFWHQKRSEVILEKSAKKDIERYFSTERKLNDILPDIYKVNTPKGKSPVWVSYKKLKECRDGLIHVKSHETRSAITGKSNLWDKLFKLQKPHSLAKDIFDWYLAKQDAVPMWYKEYPN